MSRVSTEASTCTDLNALNCVDPTKEHEGGQHHHAPHYVKQAAPSRSSLKYEKKMAPTTPSTTATTTTSTTTREAVAYEAVNKHYAHPTHPLNSLLEDSLVPQHLPAVVTLSSPPRTRSFTTLAAEAAVDKAIIKVSTDLQRDYTRTIRDELRSILAFRGEILDDVLFNQIVQTQVDEGASRVSLVAMEELMEWEALQRRWVTQASQGAAFTAIGCQKRQCMLVPWCNNSCLYCCMYRPSWDAHVRVTSDFNRSILEDAEERVRNAHWEAQTADFAALTATKGVTMLQLQLVQGQTEALFAQEYSLREKVAVDWQKGFSHYSTIHHEKKMLWSAHSYANELRDRQLEVSREYNRLAVVEKRAMRQQTILCSADETAKRTSIEELETVKMQDLMNKFMFQYAILKREEWKREVRIALQERDSLLQFRDDTIREKATAIEEAAKKAKMDLEREFRELRKLRKAGSTATDILPPCPRCHQIPAKDMVSHRLNECTERPTQCVKCDLILPMSQGEGHKEICPSRVLQCEGCQRYFKASFLEQVHTLARCQEVKAAAVTVAAAEPTFRLEVVDEATFENLAEFFYAKEDAYAAALPSGASSAAQSPTARLLVLQHPPTGGPSQQSSAHNLHQMPVVALDGDPSSAVPSKKGPPETSSGRAHDDGLVQSPTKAFPGAITDGVTAAIDGASFPASPPQEAVFDHATSASLSPPSGPAPFSSPRFVEEDVRMASPPPGLRGISTNTSPLGTVTGVAAAPSQRSRPGSATQDGRGGAATRRRRGSTEGTAVTLLAEDPAPVSARATPSSQSLPGAAGVAGGGSVAAARQRSSRPASGVLAGSLHSVPSMIAQGSTSHTSPAARLPNTASAAQTQLMHRTMNLLSANPDAVAHINRTFGYLPRWNPVTGKKPPPQLTGMPAPAVSTDPHAAATTNTSGTTPQDAPVALPPRSPRLGSATKHRPGSAGGRTGKSAPHPPNTEAFDVSAPPAPAMDAFVGIPIYMPSYTTSYEPSRGPEALRLFLCAAAHQPCGALVLTGGLPTLQNTVPDAQLQQSIAVMNDAVTQQHTAQQQSTHGTSSGGGGVAGGASDVSSSLENSANVPANTSNVSAPPPLFSVTSFGGSGLVSTAAGGGVSATKSAARKASSGPSGTGGTASPGLTSPTSTSPGAAGGTGGAGGSTSEAAGGGSGSVEDAQPTAAVSHTAFYPPFLPNPPPESSVVYITHVDGKSVQTFMQHYFAAQQHGSSQPVRQGSFSSASGGGGIGPRKASGSNRTAMKGGGGSDTRPSSASSRTSSSHQQQQHGGGGTNNLSSQQRPITTFEDILKHFEAKYSIGSKVVFRIVATPGSTYHRPVTGGGSAALYGWQQHQLQQLQQQQQLQLHQQQLQQNNQPNVRGGAAIATTARHNSLFGDRRESVDTVATSNSEPNINTHPNIASSGGSHHANTGANTALSRSHSPSPGGAAGVAASSGGGGILLQAQASHQYLTTTSSNTGGMPLSSGGGGSSIGGGSQTPYAANLSGLHFGVAGSMGLCVMYPPAIAYDLVVAVNATSTPTIKAYENLKFMTVADAAQSCKPTTQQLAADSKAKGLASKGGRK